MAQTVFGVNDPKAVKRYSTMLAVDTAKTSWFMKKMMSSENESKVPVQLVTDLESNQGDHVSYDISMQLRHEGVDGDNTADGKEEALQFYTDEMRIDQKRLPMGLGGRMTRKRTLINLRETALARGSEWWSRHFDETLFAYGSGARGVNRDYALPENYNGFAGNPLVAPDDEHLTYGGAATAKNNLTVNDKMSIGTIRRTVAQAQQMGGGITGVPQINPCLVDGEEHFVQVMSPYQAYDLKVATGAGEWIEINKALATAVGNKSPIFMGGLGMVDNVILHTHKNVVRFSDYGVGGNVEAARSLFLGRQALAMAFGSAGNKMRFSTVEETKDGGNKIVIFQGSIFGAKKTAFVIDGVSRDFGVISVDTAAAKPVGA